jgi:WD repeat-containing protein 19
MANGGIARMTLRLGDLAKGRALALDSGDKMLIKECAAILEQMKQLNDAAELYVRAEQYEKGVSIYILTRNFRLAAPLMDRITTPKLHHQYAKAKEAEKAYSEAAVAYEKAKDMDSVVRLNLNFLDNPHKVSQSLHVITITITDHEPSFDVLLVC